MYKWSGRRAILKTSSRKNDEKRKRDQTEGAIWKFEHHGQIEFFAVISKVFPFVYLRVININRMKNFMRSKKLWTRNTY